MSTPQRQGLKKDAEDARTKSFFHLLSLLTEMAERGTAPSYVLVENVQGFETSTTHDKLIDTLGKCGFQWREFLLNSNQFGIPNSRLRYFLIGKRVTSEVTDGRKEKGPTFCFSTPPTDDQQPIETVPREAAPFRDHKVLEGKNKCVESGEKEPALKRLKPDDGIQDDSDEEEDEDDDISTDQISHFLDDLDKEEEETYLLPDKVLKRWLVMDTTEADSYRSCCFTKSYGEGTFAAQLLLRKVRVMVF